MGRFVGDLGATFNAGLVVIGQALGLYKALAGGGPQTPAEVATATHTDERYVREWLSAQAAGGYVMYDAASRRFSLSDEQAFALANEDSPAYIPGAFEVATAALRAVPRMLENFKSGAGLGWHEHDAVLFSGTERFFRPGYAANLAQSWLQALAGDGTWMIVEPFANDRLEDNLNPVGRVFYGVSTLVCTPASRSQEVGLCLGAQAGEARLREVVHQGGFTRFRRAIETPFNLVLEARP